MSKYRMDQLRKYSKHLIGYSFLVWLPGFFFLSSEFLFGYVLFPISASMLTLGLLGWISKPRTKFDGSGYASWLDKFLGWLWERFVPKWFTLWLVVGVFGTTYTSTSLFKQKMQWRNVKNTLLKSDEFQTTFNSTSAITSYEIVMKNEYFTKYELAISEANKSDIYLLTVTSSSLELDSFEKK